MDSLDPFAAHRKLERGKSRNVSTWTSEIGNETLPNRIGNIHEDDWKADIDRRSRHVRFVPLTDSCTAKKRLFKYRRVGGATAPSDPRPNPFAPCERT